MKNESARGCVDADVFMASGESIDVGVSVLILHEL